VQDCEILYIFLFVEKESCAALQRISDEIYTGHEYDMVEQVFSRFILCFLNNKKHVTTFSVHNN